MTFAELLGEILERYDISQTELAIKSGVHRTTINQYLNSEDWPREDISVKLSKGLSKITNMPFSFFVVSLLNQEEK